MTSAVSLVQKVFDKTADQDMKCALGTHSKALKKADAPKVKIEDVNTKLINATQQKMDLALSWSVFLMR